MYTNTAREQKFKYLPSSSLYAQCHCLVASHSIQTAAYYLTVQVVIGIICELALPAAATLASSLVGSALGAREPA